MAAKSTVVLKGQDASNILWAPARTQCVRNNQNSKEASKEHQHQNLTVLFFFASFYRWPIILGHT